MKIIYEKYAEKHMKKYNLTIPVICGIINLKVFLKLYYFLIS
jgi:hypothetical protein